MKHNILHVGKIAVISSILLGCMGLVLFKDSVDAAITNKYIANYEIKSDWEKILGVFVEIDANDKIGTSIPAKKFAELNASFKTLFPKFPQDYKYKVVYEQCNLLTSQLSALSTSDTNYKGYFASFMGNCYKPLSDILNTINTKYMISPSVKASPSSGPAPLTVTFDARASKDPSNETIPSSNFYRYYRDTKGEDQIIGQGPVLSYTFKNEGNYMVHLTVKSSNSSKGILDGDKTVSVDVTPKTASISIYANGQKMTDDRKAKIGTLEAEKGVVFDATSTIAMGGRQIKTYKWSITSKEGFAFSKDGDGKPDLIRVSLPERGEYKVQLDVIDNENNKTTADYNLVVSDPVAIIKATPEEGNTSMTFSFDGSPSYSVLSSIKLYTWEIYDQNGNKVDTYQGKSIKQKFKNPGSYTIKLSVEDDLGESNTDSIELYVESTEPVPQFTITPADDWLYPSRFALDATMSSDVDQTNGVDSLSYDWLFPEQAKVKIISTEQENGKIVAEFNAVGKFTVKLMVKDNYGKLSEITRDIEIKSILRPEITANPQTTIRGNPVAFSVQSNLDIAGYEWDFGDGDTRKIQADSIEHTYKTTNIYQAKLTVSTTNGMTNQITKTIFVGEKSYPIAGFTVTDKSTTLTQNETCPSADSKGKGSEIPAYQIDRFSEITINPSLSVNTKGGTTDLQFYFQPEKGEIYKQSEFKYKFDEVGCHYIDLSAEDTAINKTSTTKIWFKVVNALPKLTNLSMIFPQYGNEVGIGFNEGKQNNVLSTAEYDPLIVKITADGAIDTDGFISYYKWYYFPKDDPTRYLETKITASNTPYVYFSLPRIAGEYGFGVTMYDNDNGKSRSQDLIGNGPIVIFPPDASKPDVPLVTVKVDKSSVEVGDEVTFNVISKIISDRDDFVKERTIYYDFDGDDKWDLITKKDRVTYNYAKASTDSMGFRPKVQVLYRGYPGVAYGENIIVKDGLKPRLLYDSLGNFAIFRDVSLGPVISRTICLNVKDCVDASIITGIDEKAFTVNYPGSGKYFASITIGDSFANEAKKILPVTIGTENSGSNNFSLLSIPEAMITDDKIEIMVGNNLENSVLFYMKTDAPDACRGDADVSEDSDGDGIVDNDKDFACNQLYLKKYTPKYETTIGKISYTENGQARSKEFTISFLDYEIALDESSKKIYEDITELTKTMSGPEWATGTQVAVRDMFRDLKNNLGDEAARMASIVSIKDYLSKNPVTRDATQQKLLDSIFLALATKETVAAEGGSTYEILKADILAILPGTLQKDIDQFFTDFESIAGDANTQTSQQEKRKEVLQNIVNRINSSVAKDDTAIADDQISKNDMDSIVMPDICKIMEIYSIPSSFCSTSSLKAVPDGIQTLQGTSTQTAAKPTANILKIVFWVFGSVFVIFIILVAVFAIRAKMRQEVTDSGSGQATQ